MSQRSVHEVTRGYLRRLRKDPSLELDAETGLFGEGLGLDSLEAAELSVILEDEFGKDPFSAGTDPQTVGDIYTYYSVQSASG